MSLSFLIKSISWITGSLFISSILLPDSASALSVNFLNGGFESNYNNWSQIGDTSIQEGNFQSINPVNGSNHALITTGHHTRIDDNATPASTFNYSGENPVSSTTDPNAAKLQTDLGLPTNSLSINRENSANNSAFRTPKEGSGIFQDFTVEVTQADVDSGKNKLLLKFNWSYLTNDSRHSILGNQDFAFFTLYNTASDINTRSINVLDDSSGNISYPLGSGVTNFQGTNTTHYNAGNRFIYDSSPLAAGTYNYRVGFGVVDVDGSDRSSALLVDNFNVEEIPFEFSPSLGLGIVAVMFGCDRLRRIRSKTVDNFPERSPLNH
jgi:hypothetical protein